MEKIYIIDLTKRIVTEKPYDVLSEGDYGRGLAHRLLREHASLKASRLSPENAIVLVPGLFAGCASPSSGRMTIATKSAESEVKISNTSGNMPQMLGSLNISAIVIKGADKKGNAVIHIDENGVELLNMPQFEGQHTGALVSLIKERFGRDSAVLGTGIAGDKGLSFATMFTTYLDGIPEFHCPRSTLGDVPSSKGLRAVVVNCKQTFVRECANSDAFREAGKRLTSIILDNEICGKALPTYGSRILIDLKKNNGVLPELKPLHKCTCDNKKDKKVNNNCALMCVIGCLNRHTVNTGKFYDSPHECEIEEILKERLKIDDDKLLKQIIDYYRDVCLNPMAIFGGAKKACSENETDDEISAIYQQAFLLENLGFCLFAAFALINNGDALQLITEMYNLKTSDNKSANDLILYAQNCIEAEKKCAGGIPEIIRLLYKYFKNKGK